MEFTKLEKDLIVYALKQTKSEINKQIYSLEDVNINKENLLGTVRTIEETINKVERDQ